MMPPFAQPKLFDTQQLRSDHRPKVSVLMAAFNAQRYVAASIESILAQTFTDFEFLIIDDGSTDRTLDHLRHYAQQDPRMQVRSRDNQGVASTRNELLHWAQGDYVAILDSDDIALPHRLAQQVAYLDTHPEVVCVGSSHQVIDAKGRLLTHLHLPADNDTIQQLALAGHGSICNSTAMIRRQMLLAVGGYDTSLRQAEDLDVWLKLGECGLLANLPDSLVKYRIHAESMSAQDQFLQRQQARLVCERAWQRRGIQGHFEATDPWRPDSSRTSQHHFMLRYGWWAFNSRQRQTALDYGFKAVWLCPTKPEGWKLVICALLKPLPHPQLWTDCLGKCLPTVIPL